MQEILDNYVVVNTSLLSNYMVQFLPDNVRLQY